MQHDFILLDRSGSMIDRWAEALNAINGYVKKLADDQVSTGVTLMTFDKDGDQYKFEIIRDRIIPRTWKPVTNADAMPRGMTPLNDGIGRICNLALAGDYDKVAIITMTDGLENASREFTHEKAKSLLDQCRTKGWQVIMLGADFDNVAQAASYGTVGAQTATMTKKHLAMGMNSLGSTRSAYARTGAAMGFSDDEKERLKQD